MANHKMVAVLSASVEAISGFGPATKKYSLLAQKDSGHYFNPLVDYDQNHYLLTRKGPQQ